MTGDLSEKKGFTSGLTGYHYLVLVVACLGWSFDTMDQWLFVFVKQHALRQLLGGAASNADVAYYSMICTAALMIGWATGGLFFGMVGDRLGRTRTMAITILLYAGFTGLSGLARNWEEFAFYRFMTGLGVGGEFAAGAALVAETFPSHARATALAIVQAVSALGNITAGLLNLGFASFASPETSWRYLFAIGVIPAALVFIIFLFVREPEAWTAARANAKKAEKKGEIGSILGLFYEPVVRRNTLVGVGLAVIGVIGFWGISVWTPELLRSVLNPNNVPELKSVVERRISYAGMSQNLGGFFGALAFAWIAGRVGRRSAFAIALIGCFVVVPSAFFFTTSFGAALVLFFLMGFMLLFFLAGFAVYFPELFPTRLRSTGTGFCYNVARYITAASLFFTGALVKSIGLTNMVLAVSVIFLLGLPILLFAPETKGKPLPE